MDTVKWEHQFDDFEVIVVTLRRRMALRWPADQTLIEEEVKQLLNRMEVNGPGDAVFKSTIDVAQSLVMLDRPFSALDRIERFLMERRTRPSLRNEK